MKIAEIRELSDKEIIEKIQAEEAALTQMELDHKFSNLDNPLSIRAKRKVIARLNTEIRQREINKINE